MKNKLILGTVQFGLNYGINNTIGMPTEKDVLNIFKLAQNYGIKELDTAHAYGLSEERIGVFNQHDSHEKFKVNTKFPKGKLDNPFTEINTSLKKLNIEKINTLMFHSLEDFLNNKDSFLKTSDNLNNLHFEKLGVSVYTKEELIQLLNEDLVEVIQVSYNLLDNENQKGEILKSLKQKGKEIHIRSCFLQGLFFLPTNKIKTSLQPILPQLNTLKEIAQTEKINIGELALAYVISKSYIDKVLIGVDSAEQLTQNYNWSQKQLSSEVIEAIDSIKVENVNLLNPSKW